MCVYVHIGGERHIFLTSFPNPRTNIEPSPEGDHFGVLTSTIGSIQAVSTGSI